MTLLPVLYQASGFGGQPPNEGQRRFIRSTDSMLHLLDSAGAGCEAQGARLGVAPHSLRAVPPEALRDALAGLAAHRRRARRSTSTSPSRPARSTTASPGAASGRSPGCSTMRRSMRAGAWCMPPTWTPTNTAARPPAARSPACARPPRPTSATASSTSRPGAATAAPGASAPTATSASTRPKNCCCSNTASASPLRQRNVGADATQPDVATALTLAAVHGGAQAAGRPVGRPRRRAAGRLRGARRRARSRCRACRAAQMLSAHVFASHRGSAIDAVWVAGRPRVAAGRHALHDEAAADFVAARTQLLKD